MKSQRFMDGGPSEVSDLQNRFAGDNAFQSCQAKGAMSNGEFLLRLTEFRACRAVFVTNDFVFIDGDHRQRLQTVPRPTSQSDPATCNPTPATYNPTTCDLLANAK